MIMSNTENGRTVVIYSQQQGKYESRLYVNCPTDAIRSRLGDPTLQCAKHKTLGGAKRWATKMIA